MAQLQGLKHRKMLRERDEWLEKRHAFQRKDAKWELRTQNDDRLENELMSQLEQLQVDPVTSVWAIPTLCHDRSIDHELLQKLSSIPRRTRQIICDF